MKAEKSTLPLHPASIGGGSGLKSGARKNKNFHGSLATPKLLLTFALPIARRGNEKKKNRLNIS
ncbi:hypothetical protein, partial [Hymenobacter ruber]